MIVRSWSARTTHANLPAYLEHVRGRVLPELRGIDGFQRIEVLTRADSAGGAGEVEIVVESRWTSLEAIRRFAGDDLERAVVEDAAAVLLTSYDDRVRHYEVALQQGG